MSTTNLLFKKMTFENLKKNVLEKTITVKNPNFYDWMDNLKNVHRFKTDDMYKSYLKTV